MIRRRDLLTSRVVVAALLLALTAVSASAYTIVMRDGRRVEIPDKFTVSSSTLTYELGSGIQVTMQLSTVDIPATERANGERQGSLLLKRSAPQPVADSIPQRRANQNRTITNQDLETYRRSRVENEKAYEERRKELGLPSMEERRREIAEIEDRTVDQVRNMRERQQEVEAAYWRGRATALSTDTATTAAQLDLARRQFNEFPSIYSVGGFPGFFPFDTVGFGFGFGGGRFRHFPFTGFPSVPQFPPFGLTPVFGPFNRVPFRPRVFIAPRVRPQPFPSRPMNPRRH